MCVCTCHSVYVGDGGQLSGFSSLLPCEIKGSNSVIKPVLLPTKPSHWPPMPSLSEWLNKEQSPLWGWGFRTVPVPGIQRGPWGLRPGVNVAVVKAKGHNQAWGPGPTVGRGGHTRLVARTVMRPVWCVRPREERRNAPGCQNTGKNWKRGRHRC